MVRWDHGNPELAILTWTLRGVLWVASCNIVTTDNSTHLSSRSGLQVLSCWAQNGQTSVIDSIFWSAYLPYVHITTYSEVPAGLRLSFFGFLEVLGLTKSNFFPRKWQRDCELVVTRESWWRKIPSVAILLNLQACSCFVRLINQRALITWSASFLRFVRWAALRILNVSVTWRNRPLWKCTFSDPFLIWRTRVWKSGMTYCG